MLYSKLADFFEKIESTTKRLEMTKLLVHLFMEADPDDIDKIVYFIQGKLHPDWMGLPELGMAEKMAARAVAQAYGVSVDDVIEEMKKRGDLGLAAEYFASRKKAAQLTLFARQLTVGEVYRTLDAIARATGEGSAARKVRGLMGLLADASPKEARYILRTVTGRLRLGVADMTILDALAVAFAGEKERASYMRMVELGGRAQLPEAERALVEKVEKNREILERAYNLCSDLGRVAKTVAKEGIEGVKKISITLGIPVRMMLAQRLSTAQEIVEKLQGRCAAEYKLDGERMQIHKDGDKIVIYSRRLENITHMYPDVVDACRKYIKAKQAIVEGECVAVNEAGELQPFQVLMHRRRKYEIERIKEEIPVVLFLFDCLYVDGEDYTLKPYLERRKKLEEIVEQSEDVRLTEMIISSDPEEIEKFFNKAISEGCEGLLIKSTAPESIYRAGARSWLWVKLKRSYQSKMVEPVDLVVVGAFMGKGKRAGTYGALLVAAYDEEDGKFKTVCKVGSGFTDEDLAALPKILAPYKVDEKPEDVVSVLEPDVWFKPAKVIEVIGDEITLSPVHTCAMDAIRKGSGLAIRFPRFTGRWRDDKGPKDATTVKEIIEMYRAQLKKVEAA